MLFSCQQQGGTPSTNRSSSDDTIILVHWTTTDLHLNPTNYSYTKKVVLTAFVSLIGVCVTAASAIDARGLPQYTADFQVKEVVGSLTIGMLHT